jgi:anti-sigma regulatory factor (Ser/Thr protein kinase)
MEPFEERVDGLPLVLTRRLATDEDAPRLGRALAQEMIQSLDGHSEERADDLMLSVSELVSNAVIHGPRGELSLTIAVTGSTVRIEVTDAGEIAFAWPDEMEVGGHWGLGLVRLMSDRSGIERLPQTCAWCEIDLAA